MGFRAVVVLLLPSLRGRRVGSVAKQLSADCAASAMTVAAAGSAAVEHNSRLSSDNTKGRDGDTTLLLPLLVRVVCSGSRAKRGGGRGGGVPGVGWPAKRAARRREGRGRGGMASMRGGRWRCRSRKKHFECGEKERAVV